MRTLAAHSPGEAAGLRLVFGSELSDADTAAVSGLDRPMRTGPDPDTLN